jgi:hypothetical protein
MALYVTLDEIRAHAHIVSDVDAGALAAEVAALTLYNESAHAEVANYLNRTLDSLLTGVAPAQVFPAPVKHAILILCANAIMQAESIVIGTISSELPTVQRLLQPYRLNMGV